MKNTICILIISLISFSSCEYKSNRQSAKLDYINHINKLFLIQIDDKCGEWGGDKRSVLIYRNGLDGELLADYKLQIMNCDNPTGLDDSVKEKKDKVILDLECQTLILEAIDQLFRGTLGRTDYPAHSGIWNHVYLSDSSIFISDYPSIDWTKFNRLLEIIKKDG